MRSFYGLLLMAFALLAAFKYAPIWGISISLLDFNFYDGILGSTWNDFAHFRRLFRDPFFLRVFRNNIILSLLQTDEFIAELTEDLRESEQFRELMRIPPQAAQAATILLTIGPIVFVYPFLQKHFVKGVLLGSLKG